MKVRLKILAGSIEKTLFITGHEEDSVPGYGYNDVDGEGWGDDFSLLDGSSDYFLNGSTPNNGLEPCDD